MAWIISIHKPRGNILTEFFRITVSRMADERHVPQCRNQTNDEMNKSFSLVVIASTPCPLLLLFRSIYLASLKPLYAALTGVHSQPLPYPYL